MTTNAISYLRLKEEERSNVARERENTRSNKAREKETNRSNLANEAETKRHNIVSEVNTAMYNTILNNHYVRQDVETNRSNIATETINRQRLSEERRHNVAMEVETNRNNTVSNIIAHMNASTSRYSAISDVNLRQQQLQLNTVETKSNQIKAQAAQYDSETRRLQQQTSAELGWANYALAQRDTTTREKSQAAQQSRWESQSAVENYLAPTQYAVNEARSFSDTMQGNLNAIRAQYAPIDTLLNGAKTAIRLSTEYNKLGGN